jgi:predicted dehydrogenase
MSKPLRWGVIGTGWIAGVFSEALAASPTAERYAVASRAAARAEAFRAAHGFAVAYGTYQELCDDPLVEAVYIATPHTSHLADTLAALRAGKHVLCEKPLGVTANECRRMVKAAERAGVTLLEAFMYRTHPQTLKVQELIRSGVIGELRAIRSCFTFDLGSLPAESSRPRTDLTLRGGALYDVGGYCINFSRMIAGEEPATFSGSWALDPASGVDHSFAGVLGFPSGVVAHFDVGLRSAASASCEVVGAKGRISIANPWWPERERPAITLHLSGKPSQEVVADGGWIFTLEAEHMAAVVRQGAAPLIPAANAIGTARVLDAFWRSMHASPPARPLRPERRLMRTPAPPASRRAATGRVRPGTRAPPAHRRRP